MFNFKKSPLKAAKSSSVDPVYTVHTKSNPFDSDDDLPKNGKEKHDSSRRTSSEPELITPQVDTNPFKDYDVKGNSSLPSSYAMGLSARNKYKNDFRDSGGIENQSVQELESYAVYKAEETTKSVNNCLKIAENIREDATKTLENLHQQGEQITNTHYVATYIDQDLSRGEKLLGKLGGMFSRTWKPKKHGKITGPVTVKDDVVRRKGSDLEQREKLGLNSAPRGQSKPQKPLSEPTNAFEKVEVEKEKQDDGLSNLSDVLGELKEQALAMRYELEGQIIGLDPMLDDIDVLNGRVEGANQRTRQLLGK